MLESPALLSDFVQDYSIYSNFFNWTMTYRRDSDVFVPYGLYMPLPQPTDPEHILRRVKALPKRKLVAWVSSHCKTVSKREEYVRQLQKHLPVDVFGKCGEKNCPGNQIDNGECESLLERDYMFYLSFENANCTDYVTEKFFMALRMDIVPVVFGGANYSASAPPHSFIDANDFASPLELARELQRLSVAEEEYLNYFLWKANFRVEVAKAGLQRLGCRLCKALNQPRPSNIYHDLTAWWRVAGNCKM